MVSLSEIREVGQRIGKEFMPDRVILFGSHSEGRATEDSDVDLLVIMPTQRDPIDESVAIRMAIRPPFPVDVLVKTPEMIRQRMAIGDPFVGGILKQGLLLYEATDS